MASYDAVVFDWRETLVALPLDDDIVAAAFRRLRREATASMITDVADRLHEASMVEEVVLASMSQYCSRELHAAARALLHTHAGTDRDLATAIDALLDDPSLFVPHPEVPRVLRALHTGGRRVVIVADTHVDLRIVASAAGWGDAVDAWILSWEQRAQLPDPRVFEAALAAGAAAPERTLVVAGRPSHGSTAARMGMDCLLLPPHPRVAGRASTRLDGVVRLAG